MDDVKKQRLLRLCLKNFLIVCISIIATFISVEIILSRLSKFGQNEEKSWVKAGKEWGNCYTSNPHGYFPIETVDSKTGKPAYCITYDFERRMAGYFPQRKQQVAIVGDSFPFGEGLKEEDTLGYLLGKRFEDFNFQNYSVSGKDIDYIYLKLYDVVQRVKDVKAIIYFYNLNDLHSTQELKKEQNAIFDMQNIRWNKMKNTSEAAGYFLSGSMVFRLFERALAFHEVSRLTIENYRNMYFSPRNQDRRQRSVALLKSMNTLAQNHHIKFYVVIYPLFYKDIFGRYPFEKIHEFLMETCAQNQMTCYDAYKPFENYYSLKRFIVHPIDYHPNSSAHRLIVDFLGRQKDFLRDNSETAQPGTL